jgi:L-asparaginase II
MAAVIRRLLPLEGEAAALLQSLADVPLRNWNGIEVGRLQAAEAV